MRLIPHPLERFIRVQIRTLFCLLFLRTERQGLLQILRHYKANINCLFKKKCLFKNYFPFPEHSARDDILAATRATPLMAEAPFPSQQYRGRLVRSFQHYET